VIDLASGVEWTHFDIPGGTEPVAMALLHHDPETRARTVLVRFPEGWNRNGWGSYVAAEELVMLEGDLAMNGARWVAGDWAYVPAKGARRSMSSESGALVFARFLGPAKWLPNEGDDVSFERRALASAVSDAPVPSPLGVGAWPLRRDDAGSAWLAGGLAGGCVEVPVEVLALRSATFEVVPAGGTLPSIAEPCFCRIQGAAP
jgi:hypothetical protein